LSDIGIELGFILDRLLAADLNKLIQQAGDNQMDAIRHRAVVFFLDFFSVYAYACELT
jgi:hypothetical protein